MNADERRSLLIRFPTVCSGIRKNSDSTVLNSCEFSYGLFRRRFRLCLFLFQTSSDLAHRLAQALAVLDDR